GSPCPERPQRDRMPHERARHGKVAPQPLELSNNLRLLSIELIVPHGRQSWRACSHDSLPQETNYCARNPPSTTKVDPSAKLERGLASHSTASETSEGCPRRPIGNPLRMTASANGSAKARASFPNDVCTHPGATELIRTRVLANSRATERVIPTIP